MQIIPVIDLVDGMAVHARGGQREAYRPVNTPLCADPEPAAVARAYLSLHPFSTIYVADLNAITGKENNDSAVEAMCSSFPAVTFWVDAGPIWRFSARPNLRRVVGTETGIPLESGRGSEILSLDFDAGGLVGDPAVLEHPENWPPEVILLNLGRVGSASGPDASRVPRLRRMAPHSRIFLGGGVRDAEDLRTAGAAGIHGVLVATALHWGTLTPFDIHSQASRPKKTPAGPGRVVG